MKVTIAETISKTVRIDNSADTTRKYNISAEVTIHMEHGVQNISGGRVTDASSGASTLADFRAYPWLSVDFHTDSDRAAILAEIEAFKQGVNSLKTETEN